ncbi:MAG: PaaI family thioesterase [Epsilonproteobacteria bacterium]|nr:PaaI family thioesterase [Campylobacterota bacterium]
MADDAKISAHEEIDNLAQIEENFDDYQNDNNGLEHSDFEDREDLLTHTKVRSSLIGNIISLEHSKSKTTLQTTEEMTVDKLGLIHNGFIFGAAEYAAAIAVNEENLVIISSKVKFLAPAKDGDLIEFIAMAKFEDSRKREIKVIGEINEIKIFEGIFQAVLLENHILKTKIKNINKDYHAR